MKLTKLGALALSACLAGGCLTGCAANEATPVPDTGPSQEQPADDSEEATNVSSDEEVVAEDEAAPVHEHIWIPNYELEVIPAEDETIHHDAVTEDVIEYHTVCNECLAIVDGIAEQHAAETGTSAPRRTWPCRDAHRHRGLRRGQGNRPGEDAAREHQ